MGHCFRAAQTWRDVEGSQGSYSAVLPQHPAKGSAGESFREGGPRDEESVSPDVHGWVAGVQRTIQPAPPIFEAAPCPDRDRSPGSAHRMCQCRESADCARDITAKGDRGPACTRLEQTPHCLATPGGISDAFG